MRSFLELLRLEMRGLLRSHFLLIVALVSVAWMLIAPSVLSADGTAAGARELCLRHGLGGVVAFLAVVFIAVACGAIAGERAAHRLDLTRVRPVRLMALVLSKMVALSLAAGLVLALAVTVELVRGDAAPRCAHVFRPVLPSPRAEAEEMYASYMADPDTPEELKKAKRSTVLRILTQRAMDHFQTLPTNNVVTWSFSHALACDPELAVRLRFSNAYNMRDDVRGRLCYGPYTGSVSNITQAILTVPLTRRGPETDARELTFHNEGKRALMFRPRQDVELLLLADSFRWNLLRASVVLWAMLTLLIACGVSLGAFFTRPVAIFTAIALLALCVMSPAVVESCPYELGTKGADAIGLALADMAAKLTHPIGALHPIADLAEGTYVEWREILRTLAAHVVLLPLALALLAAFALPRKQD